MKYLKVLLCILITVLLIFSVGCADNQQSVTPAATNGEILRVHFIDVGQGDSTFIELPNGNTMLIDAGENEYGSVVSDYIENLGYEKITYVIGTHPHSDHIGGMEEIIRGFDIGSVYMPKVSTNTKTFEGLLEAISDKGLKITSAVCGVNIIDTDNLKMEILSPIKSEYDNLNNYSVVAKLTFYNNSFLFTGDAETEVEKEITTDISCDVIKVGHHGSSTSSSDNFVKMTGAKYAVISCGKNNKYGHPHSEIIDRWMSAGANILRTDISGNIVIESDGNNIKLSDNVTPVQLESKVEQSSNEAVVKVTYILNYSTKKIHKPECKSVETMKEENKVESSESLKELLGEGYTKCGNCKPE